MKKRILTIMVMLIITISFCAAEDLITIDAVSRIDELEKRIALLEEYILPLIEKSEETDVKNLLENVQPKGAVIGIELLELSFHESNAANDYANDYSDWISFGFQFTNYLDKKTKAVKGAVVFSDLFGEEWIRIGLTLSDAIAVGGSVVWNGSIDCNSFIDSHKRLKNSSKDEVLVSYDVEQIIFADGEKLSYE